MSTKVNVGGANLTVKTEVVQITKSGSPLPGDIVGAKPSRAKIVSDKITVLTDEYLERSGLSEQSSHRPRANGKAIDPAIPVVISEDGNRVFSGELKYAQSKINALSSAGPAGIEHGFDIMADGGILWPSLEGRTLRELDLGTVVWDEASVLQSWTDTADDQPGIFAPAMYGALENGIFSSETVRYHVYFLPIVKAIFEQIGGFTVESHFFQTELFKSCAHTFGVGDAMETEPLVPPSATPSTATRFNAFAMNGTASPLPIDSASNNPAVGSWSNATSAFTPFVAGTYTVEVNFSYTGNIDALYLNRSGQPVGSISGNGSVGSGTFAVELLSFQQLTLEAVANSAPGTLQTLTADVRLEQAVGTGRTLIVSSCLPDEPVKDFVRGLAHLFNLEFGADSVRRKVVIEPRFPYEIGGVSYPGFYDLVDPKELPGYMDSSKSISVQRITTYPDRLVFGFKNSTIGLAEYYTNQLPDDEGIPLNGVRLSNGSTEPASRELLNPYFQPIRARGWQGLSQALAVPHLWTKRTAEASEGVGKFTLEPPTYEHPPSCGIVQRESTTVTWNEIGNNLRAPLLAQNLSFDNVQIPFVLAYGDQATFDAGVDAAATIYPGIGSTFYKHLAASLTRGRLVNVPVIVPNALDIYTEDFRRSVALRYEPTATHLAIQLAIKGYQPGGSGTIELLTFVAAGFLDAVSARHYRLQPIITEPDGLTCSYLMTDDAPHSDGIQDKPVTGIALQNGFVLPLGYPYRSTAASDAARLQTDLFAALEASGVPASSVAVSITTGTYNLYNISVTGTAAWLRGVYIDATPNPVLIEFSQTC